MKGRFTPADTVALDRATLTLASLLDEEGGTGELTKGGGGASLLPLNLTARSGSKPSEAIYETPSGARPVVRVEVKIRDSRTGLMEFSIKVDRATIPAGPVLCSSSSPATTRLRTRFELQAAGVAPVALDLVKPWQCLGKELETP